MSTKYRENSVKEKKRKDDEEGGIIIREVWGWLRHDTYTYTYIKSQRELERGRTPFALPGMESTARRLR